VRTYRLLVVLVAVALVCGFRRYRDGHDVIGWGLLNPRGGLVLTELDASGNDVLDIGFVGGGSSYRSVKVPPPRFDINVLRRTAGL
jgi:hypothetical protein